MSELMERKLSEDEQRLVDEDTVDWPPPRDDPDEEPAEPWARLKDRLDDE